LAIVHQRSTSMLRSALGPAIAAWLDDRGVAEIMLNADGRLWVDRLDSGMAETGERLSPTQAERIIRLVAHHVGAEVHRGSPRVSAELPEGGERFEGLLPPVVVQPVVSIRRPASLPLVLADYVAAGTMTAMAGGYLANAVQARANILVAGGTSTGKTTLTNALLAVAADSNDRIILIEDTRELRCDAANALALRTAPGVTMTDLVRSSLRLRPDRIPVGEVRGPEALDLLKAWGTGHPGGIGTIHAGTASAALHRMEQLILEAIPHVPRALIAETIDVIAVLAGRGTGRRLSELVRVEGLDAAGAYRLLPILTAQGASA
jgi:type IV secretion system protein VirB11